MTWNGPIRKIDDYRFEIPKDYRGKSGNLKMRVPGLVYVDEKMLDQVRKDDSLEQVANVATLPGIIGKSLAMPDIHWGYGFPIGGVAATDAEEGVISPGDHILLIDDLITTGGSIIKAAKAIAAEGGVIEHVVVLIDREEGGAKRLLENGIKLHAIFKVHEIAQTLYDMGAIDEDQLNMIHKQIKERRDSSGFRMF